MIDSALGLDPDDNSEDAKAKRRLRGLADLDGIIFVAKITVEPSTDSRYPDKNKLDRPVLPNEKEWRAVMNGEDVAPSPSRPRSANSGAGSAATAPKPAWGQQPAKPAQQAAAAAWQRPAMPSPQDPGNGQPAKPAGPCVAEPVTRSADGSSETSCAPPTDSASSRRRPEPSRDPWGRIPTGPDCPSSE